MKIIYFQNEYPVLSQTFVQAEVEELSRRGCEVLLVSLNRSDKGVRSSTSQLVLAATPLRRHLWACVRFGVKHPRKLFGAALRAFRYGPRYLSLLPYLGTLQEYNKPFLTGQQFHTHFATRAAVLADLASYTTANRPARSVTVHAADIYIDSGRLVKRLASYGVKVVTISNYNQKLLTSWGVPSRLAYCGVPPNSALAVNPGTSRDNEEAAPRIDVLAVGRLVEKKGFGVLLAALQRLMNDRPNLQLEIVGDGPLRLPLIHEAERLGVLGNVAFRGALPNGEVANRIRAARVLAVPSVVASNGDIDGIPVVILEAMSAGTSVVASAVTGVPELVDEETGFLVQPGDVDALAFELARALDDAALATRRRTSARQRVMSKHTISAQVDALQAAWLR